MKGKYNKEIFNENDKNLESFLNAHDVNSTRSNENFVFSHEENNTIKYSNEENAKEIGKEINDNHSNIKGEETKVEQKDIENITKASTTSTSASSALATVGTVATTAVVAVVGGGLALGQIVEKLRVCQFENVLVEENTISYSLALGNDIVRIRAGEENDECAVFVELTCESYQDFKETREINKMGIAEGKFEGLLYDTEYTINVFQTAILTMADTSLLDEPLKVRTESSTPEPEPVRVNAINLNKSLNPLENYELYAQVDYFDDVSQYTEEGLYLGLHRVFPEEEGGQADQQEREMWPNQKLPDQFNEEVKLDATFITEINDFESYGGEGMELKLAFYTYETITIEPEEGSEPYTETVPKILIDRSISLAEIDTVQRTYSDTVFVEQVYTSPDQTTDTNLFVALSSTEGRSNFVTYLYDFGEIRRADNDPESEPITLGVVRDSINEKATLDLIEEEWSFQSNHLYKAIVTCDTSNAADLAKWWAAGNGSGTEEQAYGVNILEVEIRYEDIYFRSVRTDEPAFVSGYPEFLRSYHNEAGIYIANLVLEDPAEMLNMNYLKATMVGNDDETHVIESQLNIIEIGFETYYHFSDIDSSAVLNLMQTSETFTIKLWVMDNYGPHQADCVDGYFQYATWYDYGPSDYSYYPIVPEITFQPESQATMDGFYYITVHIDNTWRIEDVLVRFRDGDSGTLLMQMAINSDQYNQPIKIERFTSYERNDYIIDIYARDGYETESEQVFVYTETINFGVPIN